MVTSAYRSNTARGLSLNETLSKDVGQNPEKMKLTGPEKKFI